ncbi:MAG: NAD-dependent epimerase/dehydratase family protein [Flavobacteriales bacterium]|nr:NAD-dependent epimerase/dehydratase family protein [Flavobacteriales bacterium]MBL6873685.1 NAD-dependent epimerase/dehydratase family protein [Flavobacteriales bacterium]
MERILITGGAGFIGSRLSLYLVEQGYEVTVMDNLSKQIHSDKPEESFLYTSIKGKVHFIHGDVRSLDDWQKAIDGNDIIVHLAAETGTGQSMYQIDKYVEVNCGGTAKMLDVLANSQHTIKKVIVASSRAIYGEGKYRCEKHGEVFPEKRSQGHLENGKFECFCNFCGGPLDLIPTDESSKIHPESIYGITKSSQEQMVLMSCESLSISAVALRYQNVYGPGQSLTNPYTGILSIFSTRILNNNPINVFEDGNESRDFVYIDDVINATVLAIQMDIKNNIALNVGSGVSTTVKHLADSLKKLYDSDVEVNVSGDYRIGDIRHNKANIEKVEEVLGFIPKTSFDVGLRNFVDWVKQQDVQSDDYEKSINEMKKKGLMK